MKSLYVSKNLECFEYSSPEILGIDFYIKGIAYRKLDPDYYIWLSSRFDIAYKLTDKGKMPFETLCLLADRIVRIDEAAKQLFTNNEIEAAKKKARTSRYNPPKNKNESVFEDLKTQDRHKSAVIKSEAVKPSVPEQLSLLHEQK